MAEASASVVFTGNQGGIGDNTGSAAILDRAQDFMPYAERALVRRDQQKRIDAQAKAQKEQDRKKGWYNLAKTIEAGDIWRPAVDKQNEMMNNIFVEMTDLVQKGFNPEDVYSEAGKKFLERKKELELFTKEQQTAEGLVKGYYQKINDPKLKGLVDEDFAQDWFSKLEALPVEQKAEFAMTSSPILPKVNYDDIMPVLTPKSTTTVDQNGMTRTTTVFPNKESIGILVDKGLDGDPKVQQVYEAGIAQGDWSDEEGFKDYFTEKIIAKEGSKNSEVIMGSPSSGIDINVGGTGGNKKWNIGATSESFDGADYEGQTNTYGLNWAGTGDEPKETYFKDKDGKELLGKPIGFRRKADGTYKVKVAVTTEDQKPMFSTENYDSEAKPKRKEVVEEWVDFSTNKDRLDSMYGGDLKAELDRLRGAKKDFSKIATSAAEKLSKGKSSSPKSDVPTITTKEQFDSLPKGTEYRKADGKLYVKG